MTKHEFLSELRTALEGNLPSQEIEENIRYYDSYFRESRKTEREVCEELGDPRLIARSLIDSFVASKGPMAEYYTERARSEYSSESREEDEDRQRVYASREKDTWYDKLFRYILFISIAVIVGAVLIFVVRVAVTVVIPIIAVVIIVRMVLDLFRRY